jgi:hypothetical protein
LSIPPGAAVLDLNNDIYLVGALLELDDESLSRIFYPTGGLGLSSRMEVFEQKVEVWIAELHRAGVTRELLWCPPTQTFFGTTKSNKRSYKQTSGHT